MNTDRVMGKEKFSETATPRQKEKHSNTLNMLFVGAQLVESLYWENHRLLKTEYKVKFQNALSRVKILNKDLERLLTPEMVEGAEEDVESVYNIIIMQANATKQSREKEFIAHCQEFFKSK